DRGDQVAGLQARRGGGAACGDRADLRAAGAVTDDDAARRALDRLAGDQLADDRLDGVRGDREADALVAARLGRDLRVDADHLPRRVEQRAAGVAVVDGGVGLDRAGDRGVVGGVDRATGGADDPGGQRLL